MKTGMVCATALLALTLLHAGEGGGTLYEGVLKDMLAALEQANKILTTVLDEPSALAARPQLKKVAERLRDVRKKARDLKQPSRKEKDRLEKDYRDRFDEVLKKLRLETIRVKGVPGGAEAVKELAVAKDKKGDAKDKKEPQ